MYIYNCQKFVNDLDCIREFWLCIFTVHSYYIIIFVFISVIPNNALLMNLSKQLEDYDSFLVGYLGYTIGEVVTSMYLGQDHKICVLKMLSLWRCKDGQVGVKTVEELLTALKSVLYSGPYKALENVIRGKCGTTKL